jgi:hypothetical protein
MFWQPVLYVERSSPEDSQVSDTTVACWCWYRTETSRLPKGWRYRRNLSDRLGDVDKQSCRTKFG